MKIGQTTTTDTVMLKMLSCLVRDFQDCSGNPYDYSDLQRAIRLGNITRIRESAATAVEEEDGAHAFKRGYQLRNLLKRYRFSKDTYTDEELSDMACAKFLDVQRHLQVVKSQPKNWLYEAMLDTAAEYVSKVLGTYDANEHRSACCFGSGASVGVLAREACEAARWEAPVSGSANQISWFSENVVQENPHILRYWNERMCDKGRKDEPYKQYGEVDFLTMTFVPKTFKSLRSIMPNTTLGSYISGGIERVMQRRLKRSGYDIKKLQMQHRYRAFIASRDDSDVTMDLSSASDLISVSMVKRLLPPDWFHILESHRIGTVRLPNNQVVEMETFSTMGIGYTFPLETLIFLSLLKAVEQWTDSFRRKNWGRITVYGDDMIFHRDMYAGVCAFFKYLGLVVNFDKTYDEGPFRESCGGDYYRGVDVRPFQPEGDNTKLDLKAQTAQLYKFINGLLRRWTELEIPRTLQYLVTQLDALEVEVCLVPHTYPDNSGIRSSSPKAPDFLAGARVSKPKVVGHGLYRFSFLRFETEKAKEVRHEPYYWLALGKLSDSDYTTDYRQAYETEVYSKVKHRIERATGVRPRSNPLTESYRRGMESVADTFIGPPQLLRVDQATYVSVRHTGSYTRQKGTSCFEEPKE